jgi:NAD(P)H-hydrate epimerase
LITKDECEPVPSLSQTVYSADQVRKYEVVAAKLSSLKMYELMERAGKVVFEVAQNYYANYHNWLIFAGAGNNGGDAYVVARLAKEAGIEVQLVMLSSDNPSTPDAQEAQDRWLAVGGELLSLKDLQIEERTLIVDGLLGSGVSRELRGRHKQAVKRINASKAPVVSIDVPTGIHADTGVVCGAAVKAELTVTFVGKKAGLVTGPGRGHTGQVVFDDLGVGAQFKSLAQPAAILMSYQHLKPLPERPDDIYKGQCGKLLCIGSNQGMPGAIRLSSEAALRSGAGLVKVLCHGENLNMVMSGRPELMVSTDVDNLTQLFDWADAVVVGPGLGRNEWSQNLLLSLFSIRKDKPKPMVVDADALTLLSDMPTDLVSLKNCIITPHVGEAARLLKVQAADIDKNRYKSAATLAEKFGTLVVMKGAGTIVQHSSEAWVCEDGNPGMATAGMGDLLSGVIGALVANGLPLTQAVNYAVCIHSRAADIVAAEKGPKGLLASDLYEVLRQLVNFN